MVEASTIGFNSRYHSDAPERAEIDALTGDALLEFGANWCGYCLAAKSHIRTAMLDCPQLLHIKVADGKGFALGRSYGVKLWPTLIALRDGQERARLVRPGSSETVREFLAQLSN